MGILINLTSKNSYPDDSNLSWKADGIYRKLQLWKRKNFKVEDLFTLRKENRIAVTSGINELKEQGYFHSIRTRKKDIQFVVYLLLEIPVLTISIDQIKRIESVIYQGKAGAGNLHQAGVQNMHLYTSPSINTINNIIYNKVSSKKLDSFSYLITSETEINKLLEYWCKNIKNHKVNTKAFINGRKYLERKYQSINKKSIEIKTREVKRESLGYRKIFQAMETYSKLLEENVLEKKWPWLVNIDNFFFFNSYQIDNLFVKLRGAALEVTKIGSWFQECSKGYEYCLTKYLSRDERFKAVAETIEKYSGTNHRSLDAAEAFVKFFDKVKANLWLPNKMDEHYPKRFLKYFFKFTDSKFSSGRKFKPYIMLNKDFLNIEFNEYLKEMGWLR